MEEVKSLSQLVRALDDADDPWEDTPHLTDPDSELDVQPTVRSRKRKFVPRPEQACRTPTPPPTGKHVDWNNLTRSLEWCLTFIRNVAIPAQDLANSARGPR